MAPIILVAAKVIRRRITATRIVPAIPNSKAVRGVQHKLQDWFLWVEAATKRRTARYTTAMPKATMEKIGVKVNTAVICKNAAMMPIIKLATKAIPVQSRLFPQPKKVIIFFTSQF